VQLLVESTMMGLIFVTLNFVKKFTQEYSLRNIFEILFSFNWVKVEMAVLSLQAITEEIYKLLESKCGLHKVILPVKLLIC